MSRPEHVRLGTGKALYQVIVMSNIEVHNVNVGSQDVLITPEQLKQSLPMSEAVTTTLVYSRQVIQDILDGRDHRLFAPIPCFAVKHGDPLSDHKFR